MLRQPLIRSDKLVILAYWVILAPHERVALFQGGTHMNTILGKGPKTPWHLWVVGIVSLLWNSGGAISYSATKLGMLESAGLPSDQIAYFSSFPAWASAFWALGVWGCFVGSALLLLRTKHAVTAFGISIVGLIGVTVYQRLFADIPEALQTIGNDLFAAAIWVITLGLFFYASRMKRAGVLK